jgi:hypothetical protein
VSTTTHTSTADHDDVLDSNSPLALNALEMISEIEDQVVPLITERLGYTDARNERNCRNLRLGDNALLIRRQHRQQQYR